MTNSMYASVFVLIDGLFFAQIVFTVVVYQFISQQWYISLFHDCKWDKSMSFIAFTVHNKKTDCSAQGHVSLMESKTVPRYYILHYHIPSIKSSVVFARTLL